MLTPEELVIAVALAGLVLWLRRKAAPLVLPTHPGGAQSSIAAQGRANVRVVCPPYRDAATSHVKNKGTSRS